MFPSSGFGATAPSTSSPFGRAATTGFNPPVFGGAPTNNVFGGSSATQSSGLFGVTTTPAFGQTQTTQPAFGGFTSSAGGSTNLFGTQQNASTSSGGLFGSNTTQAFGQPKTSFGFGSTQPTAMFGAQQAQSSIFGQPPTQSASGLFGANPGFGAGSTALGGTTIKFAPVTGTDTMVKNGSSTTVTTRHHCITCMKEYENKSFEELRLEDYAAGKKGPQQGAQGGAGLFGASTQPTLFGPTTGTTTGSLFGTDNKSMFGTTGQAFGTTGSSNMFGPSTTSNSLFGKPAGTATPFGAPATTAATTFGFNTSSSNLFGTTATQKPFGAPAPQTGSLFGATSQPATNFGAQPTGFGTTFGNQPAQNSGLFGAKPAFSLGNTSSFAFNQPANTSTTATSSLFGAKPVTSNFGAGGFGTTTSTSAGFAPTPFGQASQNPSPFGLNLGGSGGSLFNSPGAAKPGGNIFGQTTVGGSLFSGGFNSGGSFNTTTNQLGLGTQPTLGSGLGSGICNLGSQGTQNPISQHLNAYSSIPFGDSPLFKNLLAPTGKADELIKPTSPAAQKALISGQNYKISPKSSSKIKVKPVESNNITKKSLFDGLDGDEDLSVDFSSPVVRLNPKRLVVQPRLFSDTTFSDQGLSLTSNQTPKPATRTTSVVRMSSKGHSSPSDTTRSPESKEPNTHVLNEQSLNANDENNEGAAVSIASSSDSDFEETLPPELNSSLTEHPAQIVLKRAGYYTIPSLDELAKHVAPDGSCVVDNFTVGRLNYGNVFYPDSFDVGGLDLDEIVHFRHKEVVIYPDDNKKPPVGVGLNRRAQVTLDRVWPVDKSNRLPITSPSRVAALDYESKLTRASAKHGTRFVEYRPQTGSWVFKVEHFSKYGLNDSDEEDQPAAEVKKMRIGPIENLTSKTLPSPQQALKHPGLNVQLPSEGVVDVVSCPLSCEPETDSARQLVENSFDAHAVLMGEEDEEMVDRASNHLVLDGDFDRAHISPTNKLARMVGSSSHKVQLMKASFFKQDSFSVDGEYLDLEGADDTPLFQVNSFGFDAKKLAQAFSWYRKSEFMERLGDEELDYDPRPAELEVERTAQMADERLADPEGSIDTMPMLTIPVRPKTFVLHHREFAPMSELLRAATAAGCLSELNIFHGRIGRVGWGPNSQFAVLSSEAAASTVQCHQLFLSSSSEVEFKDTVVQHMEVVYKQSILNFDGNCPLVTPKLNVSGLHRHNAVALNLANNISDDHLKDAAAIWGLCNALWGNIGECSPDSHLCVMQRKFAVSDWLEAVCSKSVTENAGGQVMDTASVYSLLTVHKIQEACEEANKLGDHLLPLLFNQCGSSEGLQRMIQKQLVQWRESQADVHVDHSRLKCLMLAGGLKTHSLSTGVLNSCHSLSWLQAFALHLWYFTSMSASVTDALVDYESSFSGSVDENYASPPVPLYLEQFIIEDDRRCATVLDLRYHLLKLFSSKSYPLEPIFDPVTFTPDALDYRLSWLLMRVLMELGYSHMSPYSVCLAHMSFSSQLEAHGLWEWAVFVVLHHSEGDVRERTVRDILERHVTLEEGDDKENFILSRLGIPSSWLYETKAVKAKQIKRYDDAAKYLLKAGNWNDSHDLIMKHIFSTAIVNENYDYLEKLLKEMAVEERWKEVSGWSTGGEMVLEYLGVVRQVNEVVAARDPSIGYHLERLQSQLKDLCVKIKLMKPNSALDELSRAEMAKRTADLVQNLVIAHCSDESSEGIHVLSYLISQLPLPSDYAHEEWLAVLSSWQNSLFLTTE